MILEMKHRATITRYATRVDDYGHASRDESTAAQVTHANCRAYRPSAATVLHADDEAISRIDLLEVQIGANLAQEGDVLTIANRLGRVLYDGYRVLVVQKRATYDVLTCRSNV